MSCLNNENSTRKHFIKHKKSKKSRTNIINKQGKYTIFDLKHI